MLTWLLAGASIAGGYLLLWNGGTTGAAALLVLGYCALTPVAIALPYLRRRSRAARAADRPPYLAATIASLAVLALYLMTLAPSTAMWDTSEYIAAAKVLGLPHPPGNPLFILIAHVFGALPTSASFAVRMNLLAAVSSAIAAGLWFLVAHATLEKMFTDRWARIAGAATSVLLGATAFTVWNQSVVNEKVYTLSLVQFALVTWLAFLWTQRSEEPGAERLLLLGAYLVALGYAIHPAGFLALPGLGIALLAVKPRLLLNPRLLAASAALFVAGLTPFAFEPVRSAHDPAINEGEPTACASKIGVGCTFSDETFARVKSNVNREQYGKPSVSDRQAPASAQVGMWWLYWKWQWFRDARDVAPGAQLALALAALALAAVGARAQWSADRTGFLVMGSLIGTVTVLLVYYLNFKYGYSVAPELGGSVEREVRDRDYFFIWSFSALALWMGIGLAAVWRAAAERLDRAVGVRSRGLLRTAPLLAVAFAPLLLNWSAASRAGQLFTREMAYDMLQSAEPGAIVISSGDNDTFPLWYAQEVEGVRKDITVAISGYLGLDWAPWQLARRVPARYDSAAGLELWKSTPAPTPRAAFLASRGELDTVPQYLQFAQPQYFVHGALRATVGPGIVTRDQLLLLRMIQDSFPQRAIYFTNPQFPASVGLGSYLVQSGLLWRLSPVPVVEGNGIMRSARGAVDVPRSMSLWRDVFRGVPQMARERDWVDAASLSSPVQYLLLAQSLIDTLPQAGDSAGAARVKQDFDMIYKAARMERLFH